MTVITLNINMMNFKRLYNRSIIILNFMLALAHSYYVIADSKLSHCFILQSLNETNEKFCFELHFYSAIVNQFLISDIKNGDPEHIINERMNVLFDSLYLIDSSYIFHSNDSFIA